MPALEPPSRRVPIAPVLVTGASGQLATALAGQPWPETVLLTAADRQALDITDPSSIDRMFKTRRWSCVVNCAAYTDVDKAEQDVDRAWAVNAVGPGALGAAAAAAGIPVIHLSTDYVFDGMACRPYRPSDRVGPLNFYGRSKAAGEDALRRATARHVIVRTSRVVSAHGRNFVKTILLLAQKGESLRIVNDQVGRLTSADDLAAALQRLTLRLLEDPRAPRGTYHFANAGRASWYDIAAAIMDGARRRGCDAVVPVHGIPTSAYPTPARRPANSELCTAEIERDFGVIPRPWQIALDEILDRLLGASCRALAAKQRSG